MGESSPEGEKTYDMSESAQATKGVYWPLRYLEQFPEQDRVREIARYFLNSLTGEVLSRAQWRKRKAFTVQWNNRAGERVTSAALSFDALCEHLKQQRKLNAEELRLPLGASTWLDSSVELAINFHAPCNQDASHLQFEAKTEGFPLAPRIDREGIAFSSVQLYLQSALLRTHKSLVTSSDRMFQLGGPWFQDLFAYFNLVVSVVETTLVQLYYKAKYAPEPGWKFEAETLGGTITQRMDEKFRWIGAITGRPLDDALEEIKSFKRLKSVRNHLNHFDPPCFAATIEDIAGWINQLDDVAMLLWKIRRKLNLRLSRPLVEMLLLPKVCAVPRDPGKRRTPQPSGSGYASSVWEVVKADAE